MTRQLSSLDDIDRYDDDDDGYEDIESARKGMTKSQVRRAQAQSNKRPRKEAMPKALKPKRKSKKTK